ncbi:hypothetical protein M378DRAFT_352512 [Amanita muscaria Koide BX008]|uniref:Uncharacterized protein n=1 Tax=Amanita muscaria (strain Koide BX008) TaxID=946122 RepID=A0A0C2STY3_AMAMK|nr:hypothetical protein M378DRAFT_352512 [Amanita muscaria Koide BX008]
MIAPSIVHKYLAVDKPSIQVPIFLLRVLSLSVITLLIPSDQQHETNTDLRMDTWLPIAIVSRRRTSALTGITSHTRQETNTGLYESFSDTHLLIWVSVSLCNAGDKDIMLVFGMLANWFNCKTRY